MVVGLLIVFTHRANLRRLRMGTESRFERVHVLGRLFTRGRHGSG
jgi:glycerol-3-phosphate acyltransferase PlsY